MDRNTNKGYRVYNYAIDDDRIAYWLTRVMQKYSLHRSRHINNMDDSVPYAYMSNDENRYILGNNNYQKKINGLFHDGLISRMITRVSNYGKPMYGYIPLTRANGYRYIHHPSIDRFYDKILSGLSDESTYVLNTLRHTEFDLSQIDFEHIVKNEMYPKYLTVKNPNKKVLSINEYYAANKWRMGHIDWFNHASGREMLAYIKEDKFGNRLHTIVSNSPKAIRSKILIDGSECVEIDLEQSQPNISSAFIYDNIGANSFTDTVRSGDLYEFISNELGLGDRDVAKNEYFRMAYGYDNPRNPNLLFSTFPDIKDFITHIKKNRMNTNPNPAPHSNYAHLAQLKESEVFRLIWKELNDNNVRFIPVHDSIITPIGSKDYVMSVMYRILKYRLHPNIVLTVK